MDTGQKNGGIGDESSGADLLDFNRRPSADAPSDDADDVSEGSDFSPEQLAMMGRSLSAHSVPLPKGVKDVQWQAPKLTGLQHSSPIFETELNSRGTLRVSGKGFSADNCHYRSWQEDNGTAATFATERVEKVVDGHRMTVAVGRDRLASKTRQSSSDASQRTSVRSDSGAVEIDVARLRTLRRSSSAGDESACDVSELGPRGDAGPSLPPTDVSNQKEMPPTPQRPVHGVASSRARQPRPGRSISSKGVVDDVGAPTSSKEEEGAQEVRQQSPSTVAGGSCDPAVVVSETGVGTLSSGTEPTAEAGFGGEVTPVVGGQDSQQRQAGDAGGKRESSKELSGSTPSPKVEEAARTKWWARRSRSPRAPSPQPARHSCLPAVSVPPNSDEATDKPKRWVSFRISFLRHRQRATGA